MLSREERNKRNKRTFYLRSVGKAILVPAGPSVAKVRELHDVHGMTIAEIARAARLSAPGVNYLYASRRQGARRPHRVDRATANALDAVRPPTLPPGPLAGSPRAREGARVDAVGAMRRVDALVCAGWPVTWLCAHRIGVPPSRIHILYTESDRRKALHVLVDAKVRSAYEELIDKNPSDYGISEKIQQQAKLAAFHRNAAPAHCWDSDTIDVASRVAEWTGLCGTTKGYAIHVREQHLFWKVHPQAKRPSHGDAVIGCVPCRKAYFDARKR